MIVLLLVAAAFLIYSMVFLGTKTVPAYISYILAFYTLTIWCLKIPKIIQFFRGFKNENKYAKRWLGDTHLRINVSLYTSLIWNTAYAVFQLCLGLYHSSFWFFGLFGYYISLAFMRFFLVRHTRKFKAGEQVKAEIIRYRLCGIVFLIMNIALSLIIFFMVYWNRTFHHHEITAIAMAAYTFTSLVLAIINIVKYRKKGSPVYSASKAISLAAACVSMLTLESTMLTTFDDGTLDILTRRILLGSSGGVISIFIIVMAIYMITESNKKMKQLKDSKEI